MIEETGRNDDKVTGRLGDRETRRRGDWGDWMTR